MTGTEAEGFALYIHIPFCAKKCPYCAFASHELRSEEEGEQVLEGLHAEAEHRLSSPPWKGRELRSIYLGGGTPSLLQGRSIASLLEHLRRLAPLGEEAEITIEVNPGTLSEEKLAAWREAGVNRTSLGVQSLHEPTLEALGRIHTADKAREAFERVSAAGFGNRSVDLMFGVEVPEAEEGFLATVAEVVDWSPEHISAYMLIVEEGTEFAARQAAGERVAAGEEVVAGQYMGILQTLEAAGYRHYEISNWARPGRESRHNLAYWDGSPYLALGPGGHSYQPELSRRSWNDPRTEAWLERVLATGTGEAGSEILSQEERFEETVQLGLRVREGIREEVLAAAARRAGRSWPPARLEQLLKAGMLERQGGRLRLSRQGLLLADEIEALIAG